MNGKSTCKILKQIRQQIADDNDIEYVTSECEFKGECKGTCPKCEAEVRYLENELKKRGSTVKKAAFMGIALSIAASSVSCDPDWLFKKGELEGDVPSSEYTEKETYETLLGDPWIEETDETAELEGEIADIAGVPPIPDDGIQTDEAETAESVGTETTEELPR